MAHALLEEVDISANVNIESRIHNFLINASVSLTFKTLNLQAKLFFNYRSDIKLYKG